jgi:hypothetical protein
MRRIVLLPALLTLVALGAACGDDEGGDVAPTTTAAATTAEAAATGEAEESAVAEDSGAPGEGVEVPAAEVEARFEEWFAPIAAAASNAEGDRPGVMWRLALTPPLPVAWPPAADTQWVWWAYAQGIDPMLADAVRVARIWANADTTPGSSTARMRVSMPLISPFPDPQGFRPLTAEETADRAKLGDASALAVQLTGEPDAATADLLRRTYGGWAADNGVIVSSLPDTHDAFLAWLAEEPVR